MDSVFDKQDIFQENMNTETTMKVDSFLVRLNSAFETKKDILGDDDKNSASLDDDYFPRNNDEFQESSFKLQNLS